MPALSAIFGRNSRGGRCPDTVPLSPAPAAQHAAAAPASAPFPRCLGRAPRQPPPGAGRQAAGGTLHSPSPFFPLPCTIVYPYSVFFRGCIYNYSAASGDRKVRTLSLSQPFASACEIAIFVRRKAKRRFSS